ANSRFRIACAAALVAECPLAAAVAEAPGTPPYRQLCAPPQPGFNQAPGSQVKESELRALVEGKRLTMVRAITIVTDESRRAERRVHRHGHPTHRRFTFDLRTDASVRLHCDVMDGISGPARPCPNVAAMQGARGPDEVGTCQISGDALCWTFSR